MESSPVLSSRIFLDIGKMTNTIPLTVAAHPACEMLKKPLPALATPRPHCTTTCPVLGTHPVQGLQVRVHAQGPCLCYIPSWWGPRASVRAPASSIAKWLRNAQLEWLHVLVEATPYSSRSASGKHGVHPPGFVPPSASCGLREPGAGQPGWKPEGSRGQGKEHGVRGTAEQGRDGQVAPWQWGRGLRQAGEH